MPTKKATTRLEMQWLAIVIFSVLYSLYSRLERYGFVSSLVVGILGGVLLASLLWTVCRIAGLFRERAPRTANIAGIVMFSAGMVAAIFYSGVAGIEVYFELPLDFFVVPLGTGLFYFFVGFGARFLLRPT